MEEENIEILSDFKKTKKPDLPSGYFKDFQNRMLDEVKPKEKKSSETDLNFNVKHLYLTIGIAAMIAIVFFAVNNLSSKPTTINQEELVEKEPVKEAQDDLEYVEYIEENLEEFDTEEIIELLASNENIVIEEKVNITNIPSSEVEIYLLDEYEDFEEELIDEL